MKPNLTHIALHVADIDATIAFYQDFCALTVVHRRGEHGNHTVWLAEVGRAQRFVIVLMSDGPGHLQKDNDYSHLGFALESREAVDRIAEKARQQNLLVWEPTELPYPVGYFCGVKDPDGNRVEFSFGQPLGPGAATLTDK